MLPKKFFKNWNCTAPIYCGIPNDLSERMLSAAEASMRLVKQAIREELANAFKVFAVGFWHAPVEHRARGALHWRVRHWEEDPITIKIKPDDVAREAKELISAGIELGQSVGDAEAFITSWERAIAGARRSLEQAKAQLSVHSTDANP